MPPKRRAGLLRMRAVIALIALARSRLASTGAGRAARLLAVLSIVGFAFAAVMLRVSDGADAPLSGLTLTAARCLAWIAGAPLALAAAGDRTALDRREGIEALAAARGVSPAGLDAARVLAAMSAVGLAVGVPLAGLSVLATAIAGRGAAMLHHAASGLGALIFAVIAGVTLGGAGAACGRLGRRRGRWLLAVVVLGPWVLADLAGHGAWSIPGALDAALDFLVGARSPLA
jgi:hypothetical protein